MCWKEWTNSLNTLKSLIVTPIIKIAMCTKNKTMPPMEKRETKSHVKESINVPTRQNNLKQTAIVILLKQKKKT
jgi:hypothetical protein